MAVEREAKMKVSDHDPIRQRLAGLGAVRRGRVIETNSFFDTDDRRLMAGGQGLRIRRERSLDGDGRQVAKLTFKGPRQPGPLKTREETEITISDAAGLEQVFEKLGYACVLRFEKRRETWTLDDCEIVLDELPHLGLFVEVEGPADSSVMAVRARLGLSEVPLITSSYVAMLAHRLEESGNQSFDIRFATAS